MIRICVVCGAPARGQRSGFDLCPKHDDEVEEADDEMRKFKASVERLKQQQDFAFKYPHIKITDPARR